MSGVRPGDRSTPIGVLRLSVGALAELAARLDVHDPPALAARLRALDAGAARHLLISLLRRADAEERVARLSDREVAALVPEAAACVAEALR